MSGQKIEKCGFPLKTVNNDHLKRYSDPEHLPLGVLGKNTNNKFQVKKWEKKLWISVKADEKLYNLMCPWPLFDLDCDPIKIFPTTPLSLYSKFCTNRPLYLGTTVKTLPWPWLLCDFDLEDSPLHPRTIFQIWYKQTLTLGYYSENPPVTLTLVWPWPWPQQKIPHSTPLLYSKFGTNRSIHLVTTMKTLPWPWPLCDLHLDPIKRFPTPPLPYIPMCV